MNDTETPLPHMNEYPEAGTKEMRCKIGEELRSARKYMQLSIEQVSAETRINSRFIESIEEGDWSFLPSTYIKAFITSLSETVELQSKSIEQYLEEMSRANQPYYSTENSVDDTENREDYVLSGFTTWIEKNRSFVFFGAVALVIIILITLYLTVPDRSSNRFLKNTQQIAQKAEEKTSSETLTETEKEKTETVRKKPVEKVIPEPIVPTADKYSLVIYAEDTCYVKVQQTDSLLYERTLWPGNKKEVNPLDAVKIALGNAPGAILILEGDTLARFPEGRRVRVCRIDKNGYVR